MTLRTSCWNLWRFYRFIDATCATLIGSRAHLWLDHVVNWLTGVDDSWLDRFLTQLMIGKSPLEAASLLFAIGDERERERERERESERERERDRVHLASIWSACARTRNARSPTTTYPLHVAFPYTYWRFNFRKQSSSSRWEKLKSRSSYNGLFSAQHAWRLPPKMIFHSNVLS